MNEQKLGPSEPYDPLNKEHADTTKYVVTPGDVFIHTKMVLQVAASLRNGDDAHDLVLMFAALLHDVGKPSTTFFDKQKGRLVSNDHDSAGVAPTQSFMKRICAPGWVTDEVCVLVREHLKPFEFIKQNCSGAAYRRLARRMGVVTMNQLVELAKADSDGRICVGDGQKQDQEALDEFLRRSTTAGVKDVVSPAGDIVKGRHLLSFGLKPSKLIGDILKECREYADDTGERDPSKIIKVVLPKFKLTASDMSLPSLDSQQDTR